MAGSRYTRDDGTIARARDLRRNSTPAETKLWSVLRGSALDGHKFRRQQRLGPFYGDLVCQGQRLVIEIDGDTHAHTELYDARRTAFLEREGYRVLRFTNADVMTNIEGVTGLIRASLAPSPSHSAAPSGPSSGSAMPPAWPEQRGALFTRHSLPQRGEGS